MSSIRVGLPLVLAALVAFWAVPALAQEKAVTPPEQANLVKASDYIGKDVRDSANNKLGTIKDIVLDSQHREVSYIVLNTGGVLGVGAKHLAVPFTELRQESGKKDFVLASVDRQRLDSLKGFERDRYPDRIGRDWMSDPANTGGAPEQPQTKQMMETRRVSELTGMAVHNRQNKDLGDIENVMIDRSTGRVEFGIIAFGGVLGVGEKFAAVPWTALEIRPQDKVVHLDSDRGTLDQIAFTGDRWPTFDREYTRTISEKFHAAPAQSPEVYGYAPAQGEMTNEAWAPESSYNKLFKADQVTTIKGKVESVGSFRPDAKSVPGLRLRVLDEQGNTLTVHAGPAPYVRSKSIEFNVGDQVTITGSKTEFDGRSVLIAAEITKGDQTLTLRDKSSGAPKFTMEELKAEQPMKAEPMKPEQKIETPADPMESETE